MAEKGVVGDFVKDVLKRGEAGMVNDDGSYIPLAELERIKNQWTLK